MATAIEYDNGAEGSTGKEDNKKGGLAVVVAAPAPAPQESDAYYADRDPGRYAPPPSPGPQEYAPPPDPQSAHNMRQIQEAQAAPAPPAAAPQMGQSVLPPPAQYLPRQAPPAPPQAQYSPPSLKQASVPAPQPTWVDRAQLALQKARHSIPEAHSLPATAPAPIRWYADKLKNLINNVRGS